MIVEILVGLIGIVFLASFIMLVKIVRRKPEDVGPLKVGNAHNITSMKEFWDTHNECFPPMASVGEVATLCNTIIESYKMQPYIKIQLVNPEIKKKDYMQ